MGHPVRLPDGFEFPEQVNGWHFDPESSYNGHAWYSEDRTKSVVVIAMMDLAFVNVVDERVSGPESNDRLNQTSYDSTGDAEPWAAERQAAAEMVERAVAWMRSTSPIKWTHPDVNEAVFDSPAGYELANYSLGSRESVIYYRRTDADERERLAGVGGPDEVTPETYPYLVVQSWNGSGNSEISLAPWRRAHDHEREEIVETPEECGLDVALTMARQFARGTADVVQDASVSGQTDLQQFAEAE